MNSDCQKIKDQIADLVTGILPEAQVHELEQHLNKCATCRDYARALKDEDMLLTDFFAKIDTNITHQQERVIQAINHSGVSRQSETHLIRRTIMKSPITKLAVAAAAIAVVVLGLVEFIGTDSTSGVVWAEVAQKVEASTGIIFRSRGTGSRDPNDDWPNGYTITWRSAAVTRTDRYRDGQIRRTIYYNLDTKAKILLAHDAKKYIKEPMSDTQVQRAQADKTRWTDPQGLVSLCMARKHHALGQKTIDGVLCEGIETTDSSDLPFKSFAGRLWVSVETGYPVLVEIEAIDDGGIRHTSTVDQFQWNVDLSAGDVEPEIPADYEPL